MQNNRSVEKKESKGWKTKTVAEWQKADNVVWKAQLSVAPDGKKFKGIRQYVIKADGSQIITKAGLSLMMSDNTNNEIKELIELLKTLIKE